VSRLRVVIADDQPLMRAGFRTVLEATGSIEVVAEAGDGEEAIRAAEAHRPDVVLMDIRMPRVDGIEATRRLPRQRVLVLTTFGLDEYIVEALRAGASGFLTKDAPAADLVAAVRAVAAGDAVLSPQVTRRLLDRVATRLPPAAGAAAGMAAADGAAQLTEREREVLQLVAAGLSNAEIAAALVLAEPTVKSHVSNLLGKLGLRDRVQAVIWAYEHGLVAPSRPGPDGPADGAAADGRRPGS
jgi:DNA-binding NarL/FixJ family response regulator